MKNIQITVDEETLRQVDRVSGPLGLKRSEVVRQALRQWLQRRATEHFEEEWISALGKKPDDHQRAEEWLGVQSWSRR
jgi:metal-responsive CopG/Arc/MetJ family transcriptional regulator